MWVMFAGNGSLALDWLNYLDPAPNPHDGYLMVDYPGYGDSQGNCSPRTIEESAEKAFRTLAATLHTEPAALESDLNLVGLSIGCATGLNFAVHHPVKRIILLWRRLPPMRAMAQTHRRMAALLFADA